MADDDANIDTAEPRSERWKDPEFHVKKWQAKRDRQRKLVREFTRHGDITAQQESYLLLVDELQFIGEQVASLTDRVDQEALEAAKTARQLWWLMLFVAFGVTMIVAKLFTWPELLWPF